MKRRHFISASGIAAASAAIGASARADGSPAPETGEDHAVRSCTIRCARFGDGSYPDIRLEVELKQFDSEEKHWTTPNIERFDLHWEGAKIPIPDRYWNDIVHMPLYVGSKEDKSRIRDDLDWRCTGSRPMRPRLSLSAARGTVLIEWERIEECDGRSKFVWIVARNGTVLRHHDLPMHEC